MTRSLVLHPWEVLGAQDSRVTRLLRKIPYDKRIGNPGRHGLEYHQGFYTTTVDGVVHELCDWSVDALAAQSTLKPGDAFWGKEPFAPRIDPDGCWDPNPRYVKYRYDHTDDPELWKSPHDPMDWHYWPEKWVQARLMPEWATRTRGVVESVGVRGLRDYSGADCYAWGVPAEQSCPARWECFSTSWPGVGARRDEVSNAAGGRPFRECGCLLEGADAAFKGQWGDSYEAFFYFEYVVKIDILEH